jgi:8-oxo-dGTP diphosphatase
MKTVLVSAVALFDVDGRVLLTQRPEGKAMAGLWEFPGGKIEPGETPEQALGREMREELGIEICEDCSTPLTFVSHRYENFHLLMMLYVCRKWEGVPHPLEGQKLVWKYPKDMASLPMPPADVPLVAALIDSTHVWKQLG